MIIPVIDLMHGQVVQAVRGERERYRPLSSILTPATEPLAVAQALQAATGCRAFYVADLDAIQGQLVKGHCPELAEGHRPELAKGHRPELAEGHRPELAEGHRPELAEGHRPELAEGHRPELAEGHRPELAEGHRHELAEGHRHELAEGHHAAIRALADALDAELWVDAGVTDVPAARRVLASGAGRVIVGSETLPNLETLRALQVELPAGQRLFSLDLVAGQVLSRAPALKGRAPLDVLDLLVREGWSQVIVLTLDRVGTGSGLDWALLRAMRQAYPTLKIIAGGGVQSIADVRRLEALGVDGVLIASALHQGWITRKDF